MSESGRKASPQRKKTDRSVGLDDDILRFVRSNEESMEIQNPNDKMMFDLRSKVVALKKAKKAENLKVVSRRERGKLVRLWLVKK